MIIREKERNIEIELYHILDYSLPKYYEIKAYSNHKKEMGYLNFSIKDNAVWLWQIVTYEQYQNNGVGQGLLDIMEYFCAKNNYTKIQGKFNPDNQYVEPFYLKNNYEINLMNYCLILNKDLSNEKIKNQIICKVDEKLQTPFTIKNIEQEKTM